MPVYLKGHRMVTSSDQTKAYITGGFDGLKKQKKIYEMSCSTPDQCEFKTLNSEMSARKSFHVAIPIEESFADEMCGWLDG